MNSNRSESSLKFLQIVMMIFLRCQVFTLWVCHRSWRWWDWWSFQSFHTPRFSPNDLSHKWWGRPTLLQIIVGIGNSINEAIIFICSTYSHLSSVKAYQTGADSVSLWNIAFCSLYVGKTRQTDQKAISLSVSVSHCHRWVSVGHNLWQVWTESAARRALVKRFWCTRPTVGGGHLGVPLSWQLLLSKDLILNSDHH